MTVENTVRVGIGRGEVCMKKHIMHSPFLIYLRTHIRNIGAGRYVG
jgi:hypothetical protein